MQYEGCLELSHPAANLGLALEGENLLKFKKIIDVQKIGQRFEYLTEQLDKPSLETSWFLLSDILDLYDELLESFHH